MWACGACDWLIGLEGACEGRVIGWLAWKGVVDWRRLEVLEQGTPPPWTEGDAVHTFTIHSDSLQSVMGDLET